MTEIEFSSLIEIYIYIICTVTHYLKILAIKQHRMRITEREETNPRVSILWCREKRTHKKATQPPELKRWFENVCRARRLLFAGQRTKEENVDQQSLKVWTELCSVKSSLWVRSIHANLKNSITRKHGTERYLKPSQRWV